MEASQTGRYLPDRLASMFDPLGRATRRIVPRVILQPRTPAYYHFNSSPSPPLVKPPLVKPTTLGLIRPSTIDHRLSTIDHRPSTPGGRTVFSTTRSWANASIRATSPRMPKVAVSDHLTYPVTVSRRPDCIDSCQSTRTPQVLALAACRHTPSCPYTSLPHQLVLLATTS